MTKGKLNLNSIHDFLLGVTALYLSAILHGCGISGAPVSDDCDWEDTLAAEISNIEFGLPMDSFVVIRSEVKRNQSLSAILTPHQVSLATIDKLARASKDVFDVRKIAAGRPYTVLCSKDSTGKAQCFIYEINATDYAVFDLRDSVNIYLDSKPVETKLRQIKGEIHSSLYVALQHLDTDPALAISLSEIYAWTIDFYRIQKGDAFEVLFEEHYVDGNAIGPGRILASSFSQSGKTIRAYYFEHGDERGYFDEEGNSLRKAFLKAPVKFSRISSGYSTRRMHPVLKTLRPHYGTDYAAPKGTPIMAVGDGVITEAQYKGGNGNYVKMRHNSIYETQYLHMSKIGSGIKPGKRVSQGDIIGYVGSTGLATGPHVCFRFWKNGKQVDHRKEELPSAEPIAPALRSDFKLRMYELDSLMRPVTTASL